MKERSGEKMINRIIKRLRDDIKIIRLLKNWPDVLATKAATGIMTELHFRNGRIFRAPKKARLNFLFHEIWIDRVYGPPPEGVVIDIGANIGVYSLYASQKATVYAYEPSPKSSEVFRENLSDLPNIHLVQKAVGGENGQRYLTMEMDWIFQSLADKGLEVDCITLDSILEETGPCDLLKIDCEGSEIEILENCKNLHLIKKIAGEYHHGDKKLRDILFNFTIQTIPASSAEGMIYAKRSITPTRGDALL